ncbi:MAG: leucine-rich repeat domain-containing protein [Clostridia bacterium]|nr:leucine-rich repeat domain-containing protein [Clostridia bacterium]
MMKIKTTAYILLLFMLLPLLFSCKGTEAAFTPESFDFTLRTATDEMGFENGYSFTVLDDGSVVINEADVTGDVNIPAELAGRKVTAIGEGAFFKNTSITSVSIPSGVESIGIYAFSDCTALASVEIAESVWRIAPFAFENTPWLAAQTDEFVTVGGDVLIAYNGTSRTPLLPEKVRHLGGAFAGIETVYTITANKELLSISDMALSFCMNLVDIDLGLSLVYIGDQAFSGCEKLRSLNLPDTARYIGNQAFLNCYELKSVDLGKSMTHLGTNTFEYCQSMRIIYVPKTLTAIKTSHFTDCMSLTLLLYEGSEAEFDAISTNDNAFNFRDLSKVFNYPGGTNEK